MTSFDFSDSEMRTLLLCVDLVHRARIQGTEADDVRALLVKVMNPPAALGDEREALTEQIKELEKQVEELGENIEWHLGRIKDLEDAIKAAVPGCVR